jgi:hypothetical protein
MLTGRHYQNAYICDDIEAAIAQFRTRAELGEVMIHDIDQMISTPGGPKRVATRLAFIWIGDLQYELIQVVADETGIYGNCQSNGEPLRFHHSCARVDDWDRFRAQADQQDLPVVMERPHDPSLKFLYLEYVWMTNERWSQIGGR